MLSISLLVPLFAGCNSSNLNDIVFIYIQYYTIANSWIIHFHSCFHFIFISYTCVLCHLLLPQPPHQKFIRWVVKSWLECFGYKKEIKCWLLATLCQLHKNTSSITFRCGLYRVELLGKVHTSTFDDKILDYHRIKWMLATTLRFIILHCTLYTHKHILVINISCGRVCIVMSVHVCVFEHVEHWEHIIFIPRFMVHPFILSTTYAFWWLRLIDALIGLLSHNFSQD